MEPKEIDWRDGVEVLVNAGYVKIRQFEGDAATGGSLVVVGNQRRARGELRDLARFQEFGRRVSRSIMYGTYTHFGRGASTGLGL